MTRMAAALLCACLALAIPGAPSQQVSQEFGALVFNLKDYVSDVKIPAKGRKSLEHGGVEWSMGDHTLLISLVGKQFVKADIPNFTRFGEQKTLQLKPGQYAITCIGYEFSAISQDADKVLSKSAFFNEDVVTFTVLQGKTTTLEILPTFESESQWRFLTKVTVFLPDLKVSVWEDGVQKGESVINRRNGKSISWGDYHGPLKF